MTEVRLGEADVRARVAGLRAHQVVCPLVGVALLAESLLGGPARPLVGALGLALAVAAAPVAGGLTSAEVVAIAAGYLGRGHRHVVGGLVLDGDVLVWDGRAAAWALAGHELGHRGRLDLIGLDLEVARALAAAIDAASAGGDRVVTVHVTPAPSRRTLLATPPGSGAPEGWSAAPEALVEVLGLGEGPETVLYERPTHLRGVEGVARVYRVRDFSAVAPGAALLERALRCETPVQVTVRYEVVGARRGARLASRAAHRVDADDAVGRALGFRRSARHSRAMARLTQREVEVARGRSLVRVAVYLVVRAGDLDELDRRASSLWRHAHESGLRLEAGVGRQAPWYRAALPGAPSRDRGVGRADTHWATTRDLVDLRVPAHDAGPGLAGDDVGRAVFGGPFALDPVDAYRAGLVTNPNVVVAGAIGAGKSTVVKMMAARALRRGRRVVVVDPKGEYADLARAHGVEPVVLGVDGWCDPVDAEDGRDLVRALLAGAQGSPLGDDQHYALDRLWSSVAPARPRRLLRALFEAVAPELGDERPTARRSLALSLHRLIEGDLAGLFDGAGPPLALDGPLVVVDLSAQWSSTSLPLAALSVVAAAQRVVGDATTTGYLVLDEAWALLGEPAALSWLRGSWKLARARGLAHLLVVHRFGDVRASGDLGTAQLERARGLLRECETAWLFRQPPDEAAEMRGALGLSALEERYLTSMARGTALVRYGPFRSIVRVTPDERDYAVIATDAAMARGA